MSSPLTDPRAALIAKYLERRRNMATPGEDAISKRPDGACVEASDEQRRIWLHGVMAGCAELYNERFILQYKGALNIPAFERGLHEIVRRHEAWRTNFQMKGNKVFQEVTPEQHVQLPFLDLRNIPHKHREKRVAELLTEDSKLKFDLGDGPLLRVRLVQVADRDFRFLFVAHHLIGDGVSIYQLFISELQTCYEAFAHDKEPVLPALPFQYPDYSEWQRNARARRDWEKHLQFWDQQLGGGLPVLNLPLDRPRSAVRKFDGGVENFRLSKDITLALKNVAESCQATPFMFVLAALHLLLYICTGDRDQLIGSATSTRKQFGTENLLGLFINAVVLRNKLSPEDSFLELTRRVRETTLEVLTHDVPFDVLVRRFGGENVPSITPLFQVMLVLEPSPVLKSDEWQIFEPELDHAFPKSDLYVQVQENRDELFGRLIYCRDIFDPATIARINRLWVQVLAAAAANPNRRLEDISASLDKPEPRGRSPFNWFRQRAARTSDRKSDRAE